MENLLPYDGGVFYYPNLLTKKEADLYFKHFIQFVRWEHDVVRLFGKTISTQRKVAWYGDPQTTYSYSGVLKQPLPWIKELQDLKLKGEELCGISFNACLLNLYHHSAEGMSWHADDEPELGAKPVILSISLGAERRFSFKHRSSKQRIDLLLEHGSALIMTGETQEYWLHSLPKSSRKGATLFGDQEQRINLTFRNIVSI